MWLLTSAAAAWAVPVGLGVSGLVDFAGPNGGAKLEGTPTEGPGCGKDSEGNDLDGGCGSLDDVDGSIPLTLGVVAPVWIQASPAAALRLEGRASFSLGKSRAVCPEGQGGCVYNQVDGVNYTQAAGRYRAVDTYLPSLLLSAGPDVRLSGGQGIAPHLAGLLGVGLVGPWVDSDYFVEKKALLPTVSAAAIVGITSAPGGTGWFLDLSYAALRVPGAAVQADTARPMTLDPFLLNGIRLDAGLRFGG